MDMSFIEPSGAWSIAEKKPVSAKFVQASAKTVQGTAKIQIGSRGNQWMKGPGNADWVYGYDAWNTPLA
jgi:salicylate hydroxylase